MALITGAHFAVSSAISLASYCDVESCTSTLVLVRRSYTSGAVSAVFVLARILARRASVAATSTARGEPVNSTP